MTAERRGRKDDDVLPRPLVLIVTGIVSLLVVAICVAALFGAAALLVWVTGVVGSWLGLPATPLLVAVIGIALFVLVLIAYSRIVEAIEQPFKLLGDLTDESDPDDYGDDDEGSDDGEGVTSSAGDSRDIVHTDQCNCKTRETAPLCHTAALRCAVRLHERWSGTGARLAVPTQVVLFSISLRPDTFFGELLHDGIAAAEVDFVGRLPVESCMRHHCVMLFNVEFCKSPDRAHGVQVMQIEPLVTEGAPESFMRRSA